MINWKEAKKEKPYEDGTYLVTVDGKLCGEDKPFTSICGFYDGKWDEGDMVIAWAEMPAPYDGKNKACKKIVNVVQNGKHIYNIDHVDVLKI